MDASVGPRERALVVLMRIGAAALCLAFPAMLLPESWMAATHQALGLGEYPAAPLTDYLTRSISALYGFHGVLLWIASRDPRRLRPVVVFCAWMGIVFGALMLAIDLHAGMPPWWTLFEGPGILALGAVLLALVRAVPDARR